MVNNTINTCGKEPPSCANPPNPNTTTNYLDCAVSMSIPGKEAACNMVPVQQPSISLNTPSHVPIHTTKSLLLKLKKLPIAARKAFLIRDILHNLVAVSELIDAGCSVHMYI
jgi:hypothetical protein